LKDIGPQEHWNSSFYGLDQLAGTKEDIEIERQKTMRVVHPHSQVDTDTAYLDNKVCQFKIEQK
jgi:hypothetical protein